MIRFVLRPDSERRLDVSIEGSPADGGNGLLAERLDLVIGELRSLGYLFGGRTRVKASGRARSASKSTKPVWAEIRPQGIEVSAVRVDALGFHATRGEETAAIKVRLPDLPISVAARVFESPTTLIPGISQIESFEIEFTRFDLPPECLKPLEEALRLQSLANQHILASLDQPSLPQVLIALWLSQRSGWRVVARVLLSGTGAMPIAALEMIGRDIFRCECEVVTKASRIRQNGVIDLAGCYPRGWPFPAILPTPDSFDSIAAARLHNARLPELPKSGLLIGVAEGRKVRLPVESRDRHTYIVGATGTGKSTLLGRMIREDLRKGEGVILLDPHGDLFDEALAAVPESRRHQLTIIDPYSDDPPPGMNFLDVGNSPRPGWRLRFMIGELLRFFENVWDMRNVGGPMFEMYFRNSLLLLGDEGVREKSRHTLLSFAQLLSDKDFRNHQLEACRNEDVKRFWKGIAERAGGDASLANIVPYIVSKMDLLTQSSFIRDLIGRPADTLRIRQKMDRRGIVLCNLSKGALGALESRLLGTMLLAQIFAGGLERGLQRKAPRKPMNIYVDEFQNFVSDNMASMLSEARKFGLRLVLANQTLGQLKANTGNQDLLEAVLGNVGNIILFRLGVPDADRLRLFLDPFTQKEMQELPNFHALVRLLTANGPVRPVVMQTLPA